MKRFFAKLSPLPNKLFRKVLHARFIRRMRIDKPGIINLEL